MADSIRPRSPITCTADAVSEREDSLPMIQHDMFAERGLKLDRVITHRPIKPRKKFDASRAVYPIDQSHLQETARRILHRGTASSFHSVSQGGRPPRSFLKVSERMPIVEIEEQKGKIETLLTRLHEHCHPEGLELYLHAAKECIQYVMHPPIYLDDEWIAVKKEELRRELTASLVCSQGKIMVNDSGKGLMVNREGRVFGLNGTHLSVSKVAGHLNDDFYRGIVNLQVLKKKKDFQNYIFASVNCVECFKMLCLCSKDPESRLDSADIGVIRTLLETEFYGTAKIILKNLKKIHAGCASKSPEKTAAREFSLLKFIEGSVSCLCSFFPEKRSSVRQDIWKIKIDLLVALDLKADPKYLKWREGREVYTFVNDS